MHDTDTGLVCYDHSQIKPNETLSIYYILGIISVSLF